MVDIELDLWDIDLMHFTHVQVLFNLLLAIYKVFTSKNVNSKHFWVYFVTYNQYCFTTITTRKVGQLPLIKSRIFKRYDALEDTVNIQNVNLYAEVWTTKDPLQRTFNVYCTLKLQNLITLKKAQKTY